MPAPEIGRSRDQAGVSLALAEGRAHVFLCMMAYYVAWHLRDALKPLLFQDHADRAPRLNDRRQSRRRRHPPPRSASAGGGATTRPCRSRASPT